MKTTIINPVQLGNALDVSLPIIPIKVPPLITKASVFSKRIEDIMDVAAPDSYRFVVCDPEAIVGSGHGGFSRMAVDAPELKTKLEDRLNIASRVRHSQLLRCLVRCNPKIFPLIRS
jgi:hypothetical protein